MYLLIVLMLLSLLLFYFFSYSCFVAYLRTKTDKCWKLKIIMGESDNQTEPKMSFDPRHWVGAENRSKWTNLKIVKQVGWIWMNLNVQQKQRHHVLQGIELLGKIEASEIWRDSNNCTKPTIAHKHKPSHNLISHKWKVLIERSCYL